MPEILELLTLKGSLEKRFVGKGVVDFQVFYNKRLIEPSGNIIAAITGARLLSIQMAGNMLHLHFEQGQTLGLQLGQSARPYLLSPEKDRKTAIFKLLFDNGTGIGVQDLSQRTSITLNPANSENPDVLSPAFTYEYLKGAIRKNRNTLIKSFLMNNKTVVGLGNAYVDEVLWEISVSPFSIVKYIPSQKFRELIETLPRILGFAVQQAALRSGPDELMADFADFSHLHNLKKKFDLEGYPIQKGQIGRFPTFWTEKQYLYNSMSDYWTAVK